MARAVDAICIYITPLVSGSDRVVRGAKLGVFLVRRVLKAAYLVGYLPSCTYLCLPIKPNAYPQPLLSILALHKLLYTPTGAWPSLFECLSGYPGILERIYFDDLPFRLLLSYLSILIYLFTKVNFYYWGGELYLVNKNYLTCELTLYAYILVLAYP